MDGWVDQVIDCCSARPRQPTFATCAPIALISSHLPTCPRELSVRFTHVQGFIEYERGGRPGAG